MLFLYILIECICRLWLKKFFSDDFKQFLDALIRTDDSRKRSAF